MLGLNHNIQSLSAPPARGWAGTDIFVGFIDQERAGAYPGPSARNGLLASDVFPTRTMQFFGSECLIPRDPAEISGSHLRSGLARRSRNWNHPGIAGNITTTFRALTPYLHWRRGPQSAVCFRRTMDCPGGAEHFRPLWFVDGARVWWNGRHSRFSPAERRGGSNPFTRNHQAPRRPGHRMAPNLPYKARNTAGSACRSSAIRPGPKWRAASACSQAPVCRRLDRRKPAPATSDDARPARRRPRRLPAMARRFRPPPRRHSSCRRAPAMTVSAPFSPQFARKHGRLPHGIQPKQLRPRRGQREVQEQAAKLAAMGSGPRADAAARTAPADCRQRRSARRHPASAARFDASATGHKSARARPPPSPGPKTQRVQRASPSRPSARRRRRQRGVSITASSLAAFLAAPRGQAGQRHQPRPTRKGGRAARRAAPPRATPPQDQRVTVVMFTPRRFSDADRDQPTACNPRRRAAHSSTPISTRRAACQSSSALPQQMARARALEGHCQRGSGGAAAGNSSPPSTPGHCRRQAAEDVELGDDLAAPICHARAPDDFRIQRPRRQCRTWRIDA